MKSVDRKILHCPTFLLFDLTFKKHICKFSWLSITKSLYTTTPLTIKPETVEQPTRQPLLLFCIPPMLTSSPLRQSSYSPKVSREQPFSWRVTLTLCLPTFRRERRYHPFKLKTLSSQNLAETANQKLNQDSNLSLLNFQR